MEFSWSSLLCVVAFVCEKLKLSVVMFSVVAAVTSAEVVVTAKVRSIPVLNILKFAFSIPQRNYDKIY